MTNLNFTMSELIKSDIALKHNIINMPDIKSLDNLLNLIFYCLQPIREKLQKPIIITSGFRNHKINKIVKGKPNSQHLKGQAADFYVKGMSVNELIESIRNYKIDFDQLINEYDRWVHISFVKGNNRKQIFKIT